MFKVGNKLVCRRSLIFHDICYFIEGNIYEILSDSDVNCCVTVSSECGSYEIHHAFVFEESNRFYSLKDSRRHKLNQLERSNNEF